MKLKKFFNTSLWGIISIIGVLLILRLMLPYIVLQYVQYEFKRIPDYRVKIHDLDIHLYRGSYTIKKLSLWKMNKTIPVPFFKADAIDLSVQWSALFHGKFVAEILVIKPTLNFVMDPKGHHEQLDIDREWQNVVKALFPLNFNKVSIKNGFVTLQSFKGKPPFKIQISQIELLLENLQEVKKINSLGSRISAYAHVYSGTISIKGQFDPFSKQPTFSLDGELKGMPLEKINNFLKHFTAIDVKRGTFSLYFEVAAAKGKITGYAKPFIKNLKIFDMKQDTHPIEFLYENAVELVSTLLTNHKTKTIATKVKIKGSVNDPNVSILSIIGYILRHAFLQALLPHIDNNIEMKDVILNNSNSKVRLYHQ